MILRRLGGLGASMGFLGTSSKASESLKVALGRRGGRVGRLEPP